MKKSVINKHGWWLSVALAMTAVLVAFAAEVEPQHPSSGKADVSAPQERPLVSPPSFGGGSATPPNFLVFMADDLGYADLGVQGCRDVPTPNIDAIARAGVRFTDGYASCSICSPTRAGLQTGRYQQRFGHENNPNDLKDSPDWGMPLEEQTIADSLRAHGYRTALFGKWHLGHGPKYRPVARGYDESLTFSSSGGGYDYHSKKLLRGNDEVAESDYSTSAFAREATAFIERNRTRPFLLMVPFNAVHAPMHNAPAYQERFASIADPVRRQMAGMLAAMDDAVGRVMNALRSASLEERTLVFFVSDNGGYTHINASRNDPFQGEKSTFWEGGLRVPFMVQWPGHIPAGRVYREPVITLDITATILAAAGVAATSDRPLDGVNLLPFLDGQQTSAPHAALFWRRGPNRVVRQGDYKLWQKGSDTLLFNLRLDPHEDRNLAAAEPDRVATLKTLLNAWNAQLMAPRWSPTPATTEPKSPRQR
jgi:arylsulfatase A-like enzyme